MTAPALNSLVTVVCGARWREQVRQQNFSFRFTHILYHTLAQKVAEKGKENGDDTHPQARKVADVRQQALEALRDEVRAQQADLIRQLAELQREITAERSLWRFRVRRGKMQGFIYGAVLGFGGGYLVRRNNP